MGVFSRREEGPARLRLTANWAQAIRVSQEPILGPGGCAEEQWDACATSSSVSRPVGRAAGTATTPFILKLLRRQGRALQESAAAKKRLVKKNADNGCAAAGSPRQLDSDIREEAGHGVRGQLEDAPKLDLQHDGPAQQHKGEEQKQEQVQGKGGGENILPNWGE